MGTKVYDILHAIRPPRKLGRFYWRLLKGALAHEDVQRIKALKSVASQVTQASHDLPRTVFHALHKRISMIPPSTGRDQNSTTATDTIRSECLQ